MDPPGFADLFVGALDRSDSIFSRDLFPAPPSPEPRSVRTKNRTKQETRAPVREASLQTVTLDSGYRGSFILQPSSGLNSRQGRSICQLASGGGVSPWVSPAAVYTHDSASRALLKRAGGGQPLPAPLRFPLFVGGLRRGPGSGSTPSLMRPASGATPVPSAKCP